MLLSFSAVHDRTSLFASNVTDAGSAFRCKTSVALPTVGRSAAATGAKKTVSHSQLLKVYCCIFVSLSHCSRKPGALQSLVKLV